MGSDTRGSLQEGSEQFLSALDTTIVNPNLASIYKRTLEDSNTRAQQSAHDSSDGSIEDTSDIPTSVQASSDAQEQSYIDTVDSLQPVGNNAGWQDDELGFDSLTRVADTDSSFNITPRATTVKGHSRSRIIVAGSILLSLILVIAFVTAISTYYQDKAAPGVVFASNDVGGRTQADLTTLVTSVAAHCTVVINADNRQVIKAGLQDLGVRVDVKRTVSNLLAAKGSFIFSRINPFTREYVGLSAKIDQRALDQFIADAVPDDFNKAVPASVTYDTVKKIFTVHEGSSGKQPIIEPVHKALIHLLQNPVKLTTITLRYKHTDAPITIKTAQRVADEANKRLNQHITIDNGQGGTFQIPSDVIQSWITIEPDTKKGSITLQYNREAMNAYLSKELPAKLNRTAVNQEDYVDSNGEVVSTKTPGVKGVKLTNIEAVVKDVYQRLVQGDDSTIKAQVSIEDYGTTQVHQQDEPQSSQDSFYILDPYQTTDGND